MKDTVLDAALLGSGADHPIQKLAAPGSILWVDVRLERLADDVLGRLAQEVHPVGRHVGEHPFGREGIDDVVGVLDEGTEAVFVLPQVPLSLVTLGDVPAESLDQPPVADLDQAQPELGWEDTPGAGSLAHLEREGLCRLDPVEETSSIGAFVVIGIEVVDALSQKLLAGVAVGAAGG